MEHSHRPLFPSRTGSPFRGLTYQEHVLAVVFAVLAGLFWWCRGAWVAKRARSLTQALMRELD